MKTKTLMLTTLLLPAVAASQNLDAVPEGTRVQRDVPYIKDGHPRQKLDLYVPKGGKNLPLVILIHGGAFMAGSKEGENPGRWLRKGYAVASINYRLSQHAPFPAAVQDCKAAVRWLRANAAANGIDPNRFGAFGASAGGYLVTMLGVTGGVNDFDAGGNLKVSSRVQAVADWYGPTDFLQMDAHRLPDGMVHDSADSPESRFIGGPIQENREKVRKANPITYVKKDAPPFLFAHGDRDPLVPHHQSELLYAALRKAGVPVTLRIVPGGGHGFRDAEAARLLDAFFDRHLMHANRP
jgi:acetyl esterase/lipase